jgi:hypothetical protein
MIQIPQICLKKDFHLFKIFTSSTSTIFDDICTSAISPAILLFHWLMNIK